MQKEMIPLQIAWVYLQYSKWMGIYEVLSSLSDHGDTQGEY